MEEFLPCGASRRWQERLFRFAHDSGRRFTEAEWLWMRHQFEVENGGGWAEAAPTLAADGDSSLGLRDYETWTFVGGDGRHRYEINVTGMGVDGIMETYIDCVDENGRPVPGVRLFVKDEIPLNEEGWTSISWKQYADNVKSEKCGIRCTVDDGEMFDLTLKS